MLQHLAKLDQFDMYLEKHGHSIYSVTHQYLKNFSYGFWDNQWFGRNQIYLKLKLGALQFMPGIKNLNLIFFVDFCHFCPRNLMKTFSNIDLSHCIWL
jgi:hypothetical protein